MAKQMEQQLKDDILDAVQSGDIATVKKFLDEGVPVDLTDEEGWSLLHHAAALGQVEVINLLHEKGCRVDLIDKEGHTPLHYAVTNGDIETIRILIAIGSNVNSVDNDGNTLLKWSVMCEENAAIEELTKHGGTVEIEEMEPSVDNLDRPALLFPFQDSGHILRNGNNEVCPDQTELITDIQHVSTAAESNDSYKHSDHNSRQTDLVTTNQCMETNADTTQLEGDIFEAAQCGDTATVKGYLDLGVSVDVTDDDGWSPVHHAIAHRQVEVIRLLMDRGCLMNFVKNKKYLSKEEGVTHNSEAIIFEAAQCGDTATVKGYLDLGVPVDVTDEDGWSPVHHAIAHRQVEVIRLLIDRGCLMNAVKNRKQATKSNDLHITTEGGGKYSTHDTKQLYEDVFEAARCGDTATIQSYLNSGGPVDLTDEDGRTLLHCAAGEDQIKVVELLIKRGSCIDPVDNIGWTPSICATACGHVQIVQLLKRQSKKPREEQYSTDSVDSQGRRTLHFAAASGQIHIIEMLAGQGLDVNVGDDEGLTPLHYAAACGQLKSVHTLLRLGGRKSMTKVAGNAGTPLHLAVGKSHKDIVSLLLNEGCPINVVDSEGRSLFHIAAQYGQMHMIAMLAEQGLDVNIGDNKGLTPLHAAAACGQLELVHKLLRLGGRESMARVADLGGTPLHQAVAGGHKDIVSLLLNEGCPINVVNSEGASVLHFAARYGQIYLIKMLAKQKLNVNIGDDEGWTPLHDAAACGQLKSVRTLLRLGGRESMIKVAGNVGTPLHQAVGKGHKDIVSLLLNEGCPINVVDSEGRSLLHYAARYGQNHLITMLAEQMLDVNIGDNEGWTPLHDAANCGQLESVRTLLRLGGRESIMKVAGTQGTPLHQAVGKGHKDIVSLLLNEGCPIDVVDSKGRSLFHYAAQYGPNETMFKKLVDFGGNIHISDNFGMKFSDLIVVSYNMDIIKRFCVACGLECDDESESPLSVISALHDNKLLDINRILCLAAVSGDVVIFDAMVTSRYALNEQMMTKIPSILSFLSGGEKLPKQFHVLEEPLNPLHISILSKYIFKFLPYVKFIEKLTSHPHTKHTVNKLFPNGLSPLDVARSFEFHDIAVIIERAGGGPGAWADLPKEIGDKAIDHFMSLKELRGGEFGEKATSKILSLLGYQVVEGEGLSDAKRKFLKERPVLHLLDEQFLLHIKSKGKWKRVGRLLKVDEDTLKRIREEDTDEDNAYYSMLEYWLDHGRNVSWKTLLDAVGHFETKKTVDHITDKIVKELAPSQERSVAPSPSSRLLIQSGPTLDRPLQLIDTLGGQSTSSNSDPLTSTSETMHFDVSEQLLESAPFNQKTFMEKYRDRFMEYVPADAVVYKWEIYNIIDENTRDKVEKAPPSNKRAILFGYIRKNGSLDTIRKMSDFLIETGKRGYPHVKSLGEDMREDLNKYS